MDTKQKKEKKNSNTRNDAAAAARTSEKKALVIETPKKRHVCDIREASFCFDWKSMSSWSSNLSSQICEEVHPSLQSTSALSSEQVPRHFLSLII